MIIILRWINNLTELTYTELVDKFNKMPMREVVKRYREAVVLKEIFFNRLEIVGKYEQAQKSGKLKLVGEIKDLLKDGDI